MGLFVAYAAYLFYEAFRTIQSGERIADTIIGALMLLVLGLVVLILLGTFIGGFIPKKWKVVRKVSLVALRDETTLGGAFFLGCGGITSETNYVFFERVDDNCFRQQRLASNEVYIYEEDEDDGVLEEYEYVFAHPLFWLIAINPGKSRYEFHIPRGSVRQEFRL
ncbi:MAG TPA: hypothetical protein VEB18_03865 [Candidatus Paceibacterota bacterium]|nr:hypothetical protein [Candidatus Paceibacterota bacterium]